MGIINVLDDNTINKIAAGEVIERPSSVIKELVENSIDSGATAITVEIKDGGIKYIRVTDNGCGIIRSDIKNAFLRHATSKIKDVMDLFRISSLGFRGEALSSICAVSHVELLTKTKNDFSGTRYLISGGNEELLEDAGVPEGTTIIVRDLFYNTPARRKFLKSPNSEAGNISELMEHLILSHPEISFKYMVNGIDRTISSGNGDLKSAIYSVYGRDFVNNIIPIEIDTEIANITGYIGKPEIARGNRNLELFFVNNRYIKSKVISNAVEESYRHRLMLHKYPFVVLYLEIDPSRIDINVHPAKTEIKFMDEIALSGLVTDSIDAILSKSELIPEIKAALTVPKQQIISENENETQENKCTSEALNKKVILNTNENEKIKKLKQVYNNPILDLVSAPEPFETNRKSVFKSEGENKGQECEFEKNEQMSMFSDNFISQEAVKKHRIIGQIFNTYWLVEYDNKLYIIDQHAAHEKVLYEKIIKRINNSETNSQMISPPEIISLSAAEEYTLVKYSDNLAQMGFEWNHFGGQEYSLSGVPVDLFNLTSRDYFISVLDDLAEGNNHKPDAVNDRIATMACKAAVKGNMSLSYNEAKSLIEELLTLENPYNCPHGRPCIISYSLDELEKLFKRIV